MKGKIIAFANCEHVLITWKYIQPIADCIGFALYKKLKGEIDSAAISVNNRIGFADDHPQPGEQRPSTEWPIQRFLWTDYNTAPNNQLSYRVVPLLLQNGKLVNDEADATDWSDPVSVQTGKDVEAYFNRGIISSQFMDRQVPGAAAKEKGKTLSDILADETSPVTKFLGGVLATHLFNELNAAISDKSISIYASLYELNDGNVINAFKKLGSRLHLVLANGAFSAQKPDENGAVRQPLKKAGVDLYKRLVTSGHFAHNKFMVFCKNNKPYKVWTGSTNLTSNGLYTQVNNAIIINNASVANNYLNEWKQIQEAGNGYPPSFMDYNTKGNPVAANVTTWFAPVKNQVDLAAARKLIDAAKQGILFLFFNPGPKDTLYNEIVAQIGKTGKENLFVHGIMNQDPGGTASPLVFIHKGNKNESDYDTILPKNIRDDFSYWRQEITPKMVTIHSKVVLIDPFGDNPVLITGSHNLGPKASAKNDDNMNIITGNKLLASQYAVNILSVYDHFRWRYSLQVNAKAKGYAGLSKDPTWMKSYMTEKNIQEVDFLFGIKKKAVAVG